MTDQQKTDQLLANLRKVESGHVGDFDPNAVFTNWHRNPEGPQAADLIEALRAERDEAVLHVTRLADWIEHEVGAELPYGEGETDARAFLQSIARETGK